MSGYTGKMDTLTYNMKLADIAIQCIAIAWPLLDKELLIAYLFIGITQVISCIINACVLKKQYRHRLRKYYEILLISVGLMMLFGSLVGSGTDNAPAIIQCLCIVIAIAFVVTITLMAVVYLVFSIQELQIIEMMSRRPETKIHCYEK